MGLANIILAGKEWLWPSVAAFVIALVLVFRSYSKVSAPQPLKLGCGLLKLVGIALFAACLLEPQWTGQRAKPGANYFAVMVDNSESMEIKDASGQPRSRELMKLLDTEDRSWQAELGNDFQLRRYLFDSQLKSSHDYTDVDFKGKGSSLLTSLTELNSRFADRPLAGVIVLTDGAATDADNELLKQLSGAAPIYPVLVADESENTDLALGQISVAQTSFEDAPVRISVKITSSGLAGETVTASIINEDREELVTENAVLEKDGSTRFRFEIPAKGLGITFYEATVRLSDEPNALKKDGTTREVTTANNRESFIVDRGSNAKRILYISGRPNWEYKFLHRALEEDPQLEITALIRVAKREAKFEFKGRQGESSNPLFRGFDKVDEETQRYDQPVLVRMNVKDETELRDGFPKNAEDLFQFHAIVLDDLESDFFSRFQMNLVKEFVSLRGGGLLMLGGQQSLSQGRYTGTPIGDVLPLYLDRIAEREQLDEMKYSLSREGWLLPWARLRKNETDEKDRIAAMPGFGVVNKSQDIKPAATVVNVLEDDGASQFLGVVTQQFGKGKSAAITIGDLWRWGMHKKADESDLEKHWRQMLRWLTVDVPNRMALESEPVPGDPNHAVTLKARLKDRAFKPLDTAEITAEITPVTFGVGEGDTNKTVRVQLQPSPSEPGLFEGLFVPRQQGGYLAKVAAYDEAGLEIEKAETGWASDPSSEEYRNMEPNRALMENLASATGGEVIPAGRLESLVESLPSKTAPVTEIFTTPVWHTPYVFALGLILLLSEWGWRRFRGLA